MVSYAAGRPHDEIAAVVPGMDFLELTNQEVASLRSHFAILKAGRGQHREYPPLGFTKHGPIIAATILNSPRAVQMSVYLRNLQL
jgi:hypothetical protein